ncbi:caspase family protein [bacterium]|nr:caspase family protein [bacterium]MBU1957751.1 caspase family protein [bacterium]
MKRGISIHIGLNRVSTEHYSSRVTLLDTCEQDALDMQTIALSQNFKSSFLLLSENATREAVKATITLASEELTSGDMLLLTYSGHGGFVLDRSGDEEDDRLDETWCLYNGQLLDDELKYFWTLFDEGVRIFILSDSCHSGTVSKVPISFTTQEESKIFKKKLLSYAVAKEVYIKNQDFYRELEEQVAWVSDKDVKASVKLFAACQDPQVSYTMTFAKNSVFTEKLKEVWNNGKFSGNYAEFFEKVKEKVVALDFLPTVQTPNLFPSGKENPVFDNAKPFEI